MVRRLAPALMLLALLGAVPARGQPARVLDLNPVRSGEWLVVDLRATDLLDERTRSTVESGLPGTCLLRVRLWRDDGRAVAERRIERSLELDLWDGRVWLREGVVEVDFPGLAAADSAWSVFESIRMLPWRQLDSARRFWLEADVSVEPLRAVDRERVSRFVTRTDDAGRSEFSLDVGGLLRAFVGEGEGGAESGERTRSQTFAPGDLPERPPETTSNEGSP